MLRWNVVASGLVAVLMAGSASAAPDAVTQREIAGLMNELQGSQCRFQRNGSWFGESEARAHLQRKYDYLRKRDMVDNAEQFIERAASRSSISGKPYRIACAGQSETDASHWFAERLQSLRNTPR